MNNCQVFTPQPIVELMLDKIGYVGESIEHSTIFEPSFGDGAFLTSIVSRILQYARRSQSGPDKIIRMLDNVYGIELDAHYYQSTITKLNMMLQPEGISYTWPHLYCRDTLTYQPDIAFDLIIGNPPYQRVHHLSDITRDALSSYQFTAGCTDLYVAFFEHALNVTATHGKICLITPNSYFKNTSQCKFRKYLTDNHLVADITDYSNVKVFGSVGTYTAITLLDKSHSSALTTYTQMQSLTEMQSQFDIDLQIFGGEAWILTDIDDSQFLHEVSTRTHSLGELCQIQHGIATNADRVYIIDDSVSRTLEPDIIRPVVKASTLDTSKSIIFPYKWNDTVKRYEVIPEPEMIRSYPNAYRYLTERRDILEGRDMDRPDAVWYQYARAQGIQNSKHKKIALKHILASGEDVCSVQELDADTLVYSGLYVVVHNEDDYDYILSILRSAEFHRYLYLSGKNMSGGYRSVSAKMAKSYRVDR